MVVSKITKVKLLLEAFVQPLFWLLLALGLFTDGVFSAFAVHLFYLHLFTKLAIILHELGHIAMAKITGGSPGIMSLGSGHTICTFRLAGILIEVKQNINRGHVISTFDNTKSKKFALVTYSLGGIIFNIFFAVISLLPWLVNFDPVELYFQLNPVLSFCVINLFFALRNLLPFDTQINGVKGFSDGKSVLKSMTRKKSIEQQVIPDDKLLELSLLLVNREYQLAFEKNEALRGNNSNDLNYLLIKVFSLLKLGRINELQAAIGHLESIVEKPENNSYLGVAYNQLGWSSLVLRDIEAADKFSKLAFEKAPGSEEIRDTRGVVLVEKGVFEEGINLLKPLFDKQFFDQQSLSSGLYLALAFAKIGETDKSAKMTEYLNKYKSHMEYDLRLLFKYHEKALQPGHTELIQ